MRNRTEFTARFVPVGRTPTEPNKAEGPVRFLSWVGQAHQLWGEEGVCESRTDYRVLVARRKTHTAKSASGPVKAAR